MTSILIVERLGEIKSLTVKQFDKSELYKKAGFKVADGFDEQASWQVEHRSGSYTISVYAKSKGRAGQENKYDFPPPIDTTLFFGNAVIVRWSSPEKTTPMSLTTEQWDIVYEELFGGFENLDDTAEADEEEMVVEEAEEAGIHSEGQGLSPQTCRLTSTPWNVRRCAVCESSVS